MYVQVCNVIFYILLWKISRIFFIKIWQSLLDIYYNLQDSASGYTYKTTTINSKTTPPTATRTKTNKIIFNRLVRTVAYHPLRGCSLDILIVPLKRPEILFIVNQTGVHSSYKLFLIIFSNKYPTKFIFFTHLNFFSIYSRDCLNFNFNFQQLNTLSKTFISYI